jgi:hypothetical protein
MKVWKDGKSWAGHLTCREIPEWNNLDIFTEGVEKNVDHPVYGGKAKVYPSLSAQSNPWNQSPSIHCFIDLLINSVHFPLFPLFPLFDSELPNWTTKYFFIT